VDETETRPADSRGRPAVRVQRSRARPAGPLAAVRPVLPVQRDGPPAAAPAPPIESTVPMPIPQTLPALLDEWRAAGLLEPPFRPADVGAIPEFAPPGANSRVPVGGAAGAALPVPRMPPVDAPPVSGPRPILRPVPPVTGPAPGPSPVPLPLLPSVVVAPLVFLIVFLYSSPTAPPWMDEMNPITRAGYGSPEEYAFVRGLDAAQIDYLILLARARDLQPGAGDAESNPLAAPVPEAVKKRRRRVPGCLGYPLKGHLGGGAGGAYATRVTGSPNDFLVMTPAGARIAYDGLTLPKTVWECKLGYGWFFAAKMKPVTDRTLAGWDAQKDAGVAIAATCGYIHLWALSDRSVARMLIDRWGGVPPALHRP
jgi:hypothetical protein